ncbi:MAG: hypothetical protein ACUVXJ_08320 [Phycisphaerae bacterium]
MTAKHEHASASHIPAVVGPVARFLGWWAGLFGFIAAGGGTVCPCCGTTGCPVGPLAAGLLGGIVAALLYVPRWVRRLAQARRRHSANNRDQKEQQA